MTKHRGCLAVWPAKPNCQGWQKAPGDPLHGCRLGRGGHGKHECACGDTIPRGDERLLPPPMGLDLSFKTNR